MVSIKNRVVRVFTTPSLTEQNSHNSKLVASICKDLPPHFKLIGVDDKDREAKQDPTFLLIIGISSLSVGEIFKAFHTGEYEKVIICDLDVHEFEVKKIVMNFMGECTFRGLSRLGTTDKMEITRRLDSFVMVKNGSDLIKTLNSLDGQLNEVTSKKRVQALEQKKAISKVDIKSEKIEAAAKHGIAGIMEALEGMV